MDLSEDALTVWQEVSSYYDGTLPPEITLTEDGGERTESFAEFLFGDDDDPRPPEVRFQAAMEELRRAGVVGPDGAFEGPSREEGIAAPVGRGMRVEVTVRGFARGREREPVFLHSLHQHWISSPPNSTQDLPRRSTTVGNSHCSGAKPAITTKIGSSSRLPRKRPPTSSRTPRGTIPVMRPRRWSPLFRPRSQRPLSSAGPTTNFSLLAAATSSPTGQAGTQKTMRSARCLAS